MHSRYSPEHWRQQHYLLVLVMPLIQLTRIEHPQTSFGALIAGVV